MQNNTRWNTIALVASLFIWCFTLFILFSQVAKTFEYQGDSIAGQFIGWAVASWVLGLEKGVFWGVDLITWQLVAFLYILFFIVFRRKKHLVAILSLLCACVLIVATISTNFLGPVLFSLFNLIKASPSEYTVQFKEIILIILVAIVHLVSLLIFLPALPLMVLFGDMIPTFCKSSPR